MILMDKQWQPESDPRLRLCEISISGNPTHCRGWIVHTLPTRKEASTPFPFIGSGARCLSRQELNDPPTAVGGIRRTHV